MKKGIILFIFICVSQILFAQTKTGTYERTETNSTDIGSLNSVNPSAVGFDDRYEGVKGTPLLYDDWVKGDLYLVNNALVRNLRINMNLYEETVYYLSPETEQIMAVPNNRINEIHVFQEKNTSVFRRFSADKFDKRVNDNLFFEVLVSAKYTFLKLSKKLFREADYQGAYSADRRYDEFLPSISYYLTNEEGVFIRIKPTVRSLTKLYPDRKNQIRTVAKDSGLSEGEELVVAVLKEL